MSQTQLSRRLGRSSAFPFGFIVSWTLRFLAFTLPSYSCQSDMVSLCFAFEIPGSPRPNIIYQSSFRANLHVPRRLVEREGEIANSTKSSFAQELLTENLTVAFSWLYAWCSLVPIPVAWTLVYSTTPARASSSSRRVRYRRNFFYSCGLRFMQKKGILTFFSGFTLFTRRENKIRFAKNTRKYIYIYIYIYESEVWFDLWSWMFDAVAKEKRIEMLGAS